MLIKKKWGFCFHGLTSFSIHFKMQEQNVITIIGEVSVTVLSLMIVHYTVTHLRILSCTVNQKVTKLCVHRGTSSKGTCCLMGGFAPRRPARSSVLPVHGQFTAKRLLTLTRSLAVAGHR